MKRYFEQRKLKWIIWLSLSAGFIASIALLAFSSRAYAQEKVHLYGVAECRPCVRMKRFLQDRGIPFISHDLEDPAVTEYYLEHFGRGQLPVVVVGTTIIRGDYPDQVMMAMRGHDGGPATAPTMAPPRPIAPSPTAIAVPRVIESPAATLRETVPAHVLFQPDLAQRCVNGQVLEDFYAERRQDIEDERAANIIPAGIVAEIILDLCYGARGRIICPDREVPFRKVAESAQGISVWPTYREEPLEVGKECRVVTYE